MLKTHLLDGRRIESELGPGPGPEAFVLVPKHRTARQDRTGQDSPARVGPWLKRQEGLQDDDHSPFESARGRSEHRGSCGCLGHAAGERRARTVAKRWPAVLGQEWRPHLSVTALRAGPLLSQLLGLLAAGSERRPAERVPLAQARCTLPLSKQLLRKALASSVFSLFYFYFLKSKTKRGQCQIPKRSEPGWTDPQAKGNVSARGHWTDFTLRAGPSPEKDRVP